MSDTIYMGKGYYRYEFNHNWLTFPSGRNPVIPIYADVQGLAEDPLTGNLYVAFAETTRGNYPPADAIAVFGANGKFVRSFGKEAFRGAHSIRFQRTMSEQYVYVTCIHSKRIYKYNALSGKLLLSIGRPKGLPKNKGYIPTDVLPLEDQSFIVTDGGSGLILVFDAEGKLREKRKYRKSKVNALKNPHGITLVNDNLLLICDRKNERLVSTNLKGKKEKEIKLKCNGRELAHHPSNLSFDPTSKLLLVSNLWHVLEIYKDYEQVASLGDGQFNHNIEVGIYSDSSLTLRRYFESGVVATEGELDRLIQDQYFLYPHNAIWTKKHSGRAGNILVCECNFYKRGSGVTLLRHSPE